MSDHKCVKKENIIFDLEVSRSMIHSLFIDEYLSTHLRSTYVPRLIGGLKRKGLKK